MVRPDGVGGGSAYPQFDEHTPDGGSIISQGDAVTRTSTEFHTVRDRVVAEHDRARAGVEVSRRRP